MEASPLEEEEDDDEPLEPDEEAGEEEPFELDDPEEEEDLPFALEERNILRVKATTATMLARGVIDTKRDASSKFLGRAVLIFSYV